MTEKEKIRDEIAWLKRKGVIRFDKQIAQALHYTPATISEMLSPTSDVPVSRFFKDKFYNAYGRHLKTNNQPEPITILINKVNDLQQLIIKLQGQIVAMEEKIDKLL